MKPIILQDKVFLWLEKRQQPMHVAGLALFKIPENAGPNYLSEFASWLRSFDEPVEPFNLRVVKKGLNYYWDKDPNIDMEYHFRHHALPKPGRIRELLSFIGAEQGRTLDRQHPLWRAHLIEGIEGNRFALFVQVHHALVDGVGAINKAMRAFSTDPNERTAPVWAIPTTKHNRKKSAQGIRSLPQFVKSTAGYVKSARKIVNEVSKTIAESNDQPHMLSVFEAPDSILNQPITGSRRFMADQVALERVKTLANACDSTLNNVVLAACGSALRKYLLSQDALPERSLTAMFPFSYRRENSDSGNEIHMLVASLGTHIADPLERLRSVETSANQTKRRANALSVEEMIGYSALTLGPTGINIITGKADRLRAFNVVISNIRGPKETLYWNSAELEGIYPISVPLDNIALNITLISYADQLGFGITACSNTLPSMQKLMDYIREGFTELEKAVGITAKKTPANDFLTELA